MLFCTSTTLLIFTITTHINPLLAVAVAVPALHLTPRSTSNNTWTPLPNTTATCADRSKYMSLVIGPENAQTILKHSCAAFMPACAYPEENALDGNSTTCEPVGVYALDGPRNKTLNVLVESEGNKMGGWAVNFYVTPAVHDNGEPVQWTTSDCEGYMNLLVTQTEPNGCLIPGTGPGAGELTVGTPKDGLTSSLTGTVMGVRFVKR